MTLSLPRLLLAACLAFVSAPAAWAAGADFQRHTLTVPLIQKVQQATRDMEKVVPQGKKGAKDEDDDKDDDESVEGMVRKIDATPGAKAVLARHGLTSQTYALTVLALFQAGFYLAMEPSMDKKKGAALLASYPKETQANIELLRKNRELLKN